LEGLKKTTENFKIFSVTAKILTKNLPNITALNFYNSFNGLLVGVSAAVCVSGNAPLRKYFNKTILKMSPTYLYDGN
jgi:hypothetical protein